MQWDDSVHHGFTTGTPWLQPVLHDDYSVTKVMQAPDNVFAFYQTVIRLRQGQPLLLSGQYRLLAADDEAVYTYERFDQQQVIRVMANFTDQVQVREMPEGVQSLLGNYPEQTMKDQKITLQPYEAVMVRYTEEG